MDANGLFYYLTGFFELVGENPTREQWGVIRAKVLSATPVAREPQLHNPNNAVPPFLDMRKLPQMPADCGCGPQKP